VLRGLDELRERRQPVAGLGETGGVHLDQQGVVALDDERVVLSISRHARRL